MLGGRGGCLSKSWRCCIETICRNINSWKESDDAVRRKSWSFVGHWWCGRYCCAGDCDRNATKKVDQFFEDIKLRSFFFSSSSFLRRLILDNAF
mmetsp:Transcript_8141/g.11867  ORF Transcript_8141/g.11867 Transcript_8141/m.11867 type:complete len:94 (-) Transcript_8141:54-335(-)